VDGYLKVMETHQSTLRSAIADALQQCNATDAFLYDAIGNDPNELLNRSYSLQSELQSHIDPLQNAMSCPPVVGNIQFVEHADAREQFISSMPTLSTLVDDTPAPGHCEVLGDIFGAVEGVSLPLTIVAKDVDGNRLLTGGATFMIRIEPLWFVDSKMPLTPSDIPVIDKNNGIYTASWLCGPAGDSFFVLSLARSCALANVRH
jgi:hypothetical protein